jgi:hypothetical protein
VEPERPGDATADLDGPNITRSPLCGALALKRNANSIDALSREQSIRDSGAFQPDMAFSRHQAPVDHASTAQSDLCDIQIRSCGEEKLFATLLQSFSHCVFNDKRTGPIEATSRLPSRTSGVVLKLTFPSRVSANRCVRWLKAQILSGRRS